MRLAPHVVGILVVMSAVGAAEAQDRVARGQALAEAWCVRCHAIGEETQPSALADAPSFAAIAASPGFGEARLANALLAPHPVMPQFPLSNDDIASLEAYIGSVKPAQ